MTIEELKAWGVAASGTGVFGLCAYCAVKLFGSGKERMEDGQVHRRAQEAVYQTTLKALETQIAGINGQNQLLVEQLRTSWAENEKLRGSWVGDYTAHEKDRQMAEEDRQAALIKAAVLEGEIKLLHIEVAALKRENVRLTTMAVAPNVYPQGFLDIPPAAP